ncbi:MAG: T9SS type A sorting domain-containing protein [Ignavibacteriaceae bacterium]|nr:T9SS type A sorting domain-containing protein [Ignavibacteriaceae bacterium]
MNKKSYLLTLLFLFTLLLLPVEVIAQQSKYWDKVSPQLAQRNMFKRYKWFHAPRMFPYDSIPVTYYKKIREGIVEKIQSGNRGSSYYEQVNWSPMGPISISPYNPAHWQAASGRVRGLAVHPTNPDIAYIGVSAGGLWKTTDGGQNWSDLSGFLNTITFGAIEIDKNNPNVIYAGTGEMIAGGYSIAYAGDGLYKSTDDGASWQHITNGFGSRTAFGAIKVHPTNSNIVVAAVGIGNTNIGYADGNGGIWRSTDAGASWSRTLEVPEAYDVKFNPSNPNIVYAAVGSMLNTTGVYKSTDAGATWSYSSNGLPVGTEIKRVQIALAPSQPSTIYAYINLPNETPLKSHLYKSTDNGNNWVQIAVNENLGGDYGDGPVDQGDYDLCIAVDPSNPNKVYLGNVEFFVSTNGNNFTPVRIAGGTGAFESVSHVDYHAIVFSPSNPSVIYIGNDGGVTRSTDGGQSWNSLNHTLTTLQFYRIASSKNDRNILAGGFQDNGCALGLNGNSSWKSTATGDGQEHFFSGSNPNLFFGSAQQGALYAFQIENGNVNQTSMTFPQGEQFPWTTPFFEDATTNTTIYAASNRLFKSTNLGQDWEPTTAQGVSQNTVTDVTQSKVNPQLFYLVAGEDEIFVSTDGGLNWDNKSSANPQPSRALQRIVPDPVDANTVYLVRSGYGSPQIYKSTNQGTSWSDIQSDLPDLPANDFFVDPSNPSFYFIANDAGVYYSSNSGANWMRLGSNLPVVPVFDFDYANYQSERLLRIGTHGRGAWEVNLDAVSSVQIESFTASVSPEGTLLRWNTTKESGNKGFHVERSYDRNNFETIAFISAKGNGSYTFNDAANRNKAWYRLKAEESDGSFRYFSIVETEGVPVQFGVAQNYPNPFNPVTVIKFTIPSESAVKVSVFNPLGQKVDEILNANLAAGEHEAIWNAASFTSGVYFYSVEVSDNTGNLIFSSMKKMILVK